MFAPPADLAPTTSITEVIRPGPKDPTNNPAQSPNGENPDGEVHNHRLKNSNSYTPDFR